VQVLLHEGVARIATRLLWQEGDTPATEAGTDSDDGWTTHTLARVGGPTDGSGEPGAPDLTEIRTRCTEYWPWERIEQMYQRRGVGGYGFDWSVTSLHRGTGELIAELSVLTPPTKEPVSRPAVLDGALTLTPLLLPDDDVLRMPAHIREVTVHGTPTDRFVVYARLWPGRSHDTVDVYITDLDGRDIATVRGLRFGELQGTPGSATAPRHLAHQLDWRPLDPAGRSRTAPWEAVVLIGADDGSRPEITRALADSGIPWTSAATPQEAAALCARRPSVALVLPPVPGPSNLPEDAAADHAWLLIHTAQCLARASGHQTRLWCLTRGVRQCPDETALAQAPLWGAARIIAGEHGELWGGLIDLAPEVLADDPRLCPLLRTAGSDDVISLTADGSWVPRLTPIAQEPRHQSQRCRPDGTYLITGGLGALGLEVARWLVGQGARRLLLAGRHGLPPREHWARSTDATEQSRIEAVQALEALGATVRVLALDITDHDRAAAELGPAALGMPPIRGVVHAAGVVHDARVTQLGKEDLGQVLSPKVRGAMVLHRLFPPGSLDFLVLFSSSGQYARPTGQVAYAAANAFLDALAVHRHKTGHRETLSLGWMAWSGLGMSEQIAASMLEVNDRGIDAVSPLEAFRAWRFADRYALPYAAILKPLGPGPGKDRLPVLTELAATVEERAATGSSEGFPEEWTSLTPEELRIHITGDLRLLAATELGMKVDELSTKRPLPDLGMDSVMTVALRIRIRHRYGIDLPPTILWNQPTITALAAHLVERIVS
jgi:6-methylsalicylic acid synthase